MVPRNSSSHRAVSKSKSGESQLDYQDMAGSFKHNLLIDVNHVNYGSFVPELWRLERTGDNRTSLKISILLSGFQAVPSTKNCRTHSEDNLKKYILVSNPK